MAKTVRLTGSPRRPTFHLSNQAMASFGKVDDSWVCRLGSLKLKKKKIPNIFLLYSKLNLDRTRKSMERREFKNSFVKKLKIWILLGVVIVQDPNFCWAPFLNEKEKRKENLIDNYLASIQMFKSENSIQLLLLMLRPIDAPYAYLNVSCNPNLFHLEATHINTYSVSAIQNKWKRQLVK